MPLDNIENLCSDVLFMGKPLPEYLPPFGQDAHYHRRALDPHVKRRVVVRDRSRCVQCGSSNQVEIDHIVPVWAGGEDDADNLETLCRVCHRAKTSREHAQRAAFRRRMCTRPHPRALVLPKRVYWWEQGEIGETGA